MLVALSIVGFARATPQTWKGGEEGGFPSAAGGQSGEKTCGDWHTDCAARSPCRCCIGCSQGCWSAAGAAAEAAATTAAAKWDDLHAETSAHKGTPRGAEGDLDFKALLRKIPFSFSTRLGAIRGEDKEVGSGLATWRQATHVTGSGRLWLQRPPPPAFSSRIRQCFFWGSLSHDGYLPERFKACSRRHSRNTSAVAFGSYKWVERAGGLSFTPKPWPFFWCLCFLWARALGCSEGFPVERLACSVRSLSRFLS